MGKHEIVGRIRCSDGKFYRVKDGRCLGCGAKVSLDVQEEVSDVSKPFDRNPSE